MRVFFDETRELRLRKNDLGPVVEYATRLLAGSYDEETINITWSSESSPNVKVEHVARNSDDVANTMWIEDTDDLRKALCSTYVYGDATLRITAGHLPAKSSRERITGAEPTARALRRLTTGYKDVPFGSL